MCLVIEKDIRWKALVQMCFNYSKLRKNKLDCWVCLFTSTWCYRLCSRPFYSHCKWVLCDKKWVQAADPAIRLQIYPCPPTDPRLSAAHGPMRKMKTLACLLQKNSPPAAIPLHFLQLYWSTLGGVIAEWPRRSQCACTHVCFSLLMHPPVVDVLLWEGVNPLNLNWADVSAHHSVSSVRHVSFFFFFYPPVETQSVS